MCALLALLPSFVMAEKKVPVFLVGNGLVGSTLLKQIEMHHDWLLQRYGVDIQVAAVANSKEMRFENSVEPMSLEGFLHKMCDFPLEHAVFVDCTSSQVVADAYGAILKSGVSIVTPNKKANSGKFETYQTLKALSGNNKTKFYYDANAGAGLPLIHTVSSLQKSGDTIVKMDAILSGTLSYLFNSFEEGTGFSDIVREAQKRGYTEPDPRDDLNGMDVARKLLILAREAGYALEMEDIDLQRFLPDSCFDAASVEEFYEKLKAYDKVMSEMRENAAKEGKRLRYIASFTNGNASISLQAVSPDHSFYHLSGNDNIMAITTKYYSRNPLVIKGPGAGADVTAAKVLEGILDVGLDLVE